MKKLLVLVEEIADQDYLISNALKMANFWGAQLLIGHVRPPTALVLGRTIMSEAIEEKSRYLLEKENIAKWLISLKEYNWKEHAILIEGNSIESLLIVIEEYDVDFVVTQSGTRSWIKEKMLGSSWSSLFADCKVPVVVYPRLATSEEVKVKEFFTVNSVNV